MSEPVHPLPTEMDTLIRLVRSIVLAQGNVFIKELLRDKGIRIGTTKADFERNMVDAIQAGQLQRHHVESWLKEVEGWGDQHAYVYRIPRTLCNWIRDLTQVERKVRGGGLERYWNAQISLEYPPERTLTRIYADQEELGFTWHQGSEFLIRKADLDYREERDGDLYAFRAYRVRGQRSVARFVARPKDELAGIFLQIAWDEEEHATVIQDIRNVVSRVLPFDDLQPLTIASAIKKLDTKSLQGRSIVARSTRLSSGGAYVEFASTSTSLGYQDVGPVREVRQAVQPRSFVGMNGNFFLPCTDRNEGTRKVRVQLYGEQRRLKLAHQMTASEVWSIIQLVQENL